jgi:hypothetical protein
MTGRRSRPGLGRLLLGGVGLGLGAFGAAGLVDDARLGHPLAVLGWLAAVLVAHDGLLLPAIVAVGAGLGRVLPPGPRGIVRGGLGIAAVTALVTAPLLVRKGVIRNPSMLPLDYARNLLLILLAVAGATAALAAVHAVTRTRRGRRGPRPVGQAAAGPLGRPGAAERTLGGPDETGG